MMEPEPTGASRKDTENPPFPLLSRAERSGARDTERSEGERARRVASGFNG